MANCYRLFILNGPNGVTEVPVEGTVVSVKNRGDLSNINEIQIDGVLQFSLPMDHPTVSGLLNSRWCPGAIQQEPYKIRLMVGHEVLPQKFLFCGTLSESGRTFGVSASWGRDNFIIAANECRLCDIFKFELPDIVNGGTFESCATISLPGGLTGSSIQQVIQDAMDDHLYDSSQSPAMLVPACYGGFVYDGSGLSPADFRPWFSFLHVLKQGACKIGWKINAPIFENSMFRRMWVYILSSNYGNQAYINQYGTLDTAFNQYRWIFAVTSGTDLYTSGISIPNGKYCITFDQVVQDNFGVLDQIIPTNAWSDIALFRNLLQGLCLRFKLFQTNENWEGEIKISIYQKDPEFTGGPVNLPNGGTMTVPGQVSTLVGEQTFNISFDEDDPSYILEGAIEIDCLKLKKPTDLNPGCLNVCIERISSTTPEASVPVLEVEYFEFFNKPKRFFYSAGDAINFCDAVKCDTSYLDYVKAGIGVIGGVVDINEISQTLNIYPPRTVVMPDGEIIEGYDDDLPPVKLDGLLLCETQEGVKDNANQPRYCRVGFKKSTDALINELYEPDSEPFSTTIDRGEEYDANQTAEKLNHAFEPTIWKESLEASCNSVPVHLPNLSDNDNGDVSFDIGCRIMLATPCAQEYEGGQQAELNVCGECFTEWIQLYHVMPQNRTDENFTLV